MKVGVYGIRRDVQDLVLSRLVQLLGTDASSLQTDYHHRRFIFQHQEGGPNFAAPGIVIGFELEIGRLKKLSSEFPKLVFGTNKGAHYQDGWMLCGVTTT